MFGAISGILVKATLSVYISFTGIVYETTFFNPNNGPYLVHEIQRIKNIEINRAERMD